MLVPGVQDGGDKEPAGDSKKPSEGDASSKAKRLSPSRVQLKSVAKFIRRIRRPTFDALDAGQIWSLEEGYKIAGDDSLKEVVKRVRHATRKCGSSIAAKEYFANVDIAGLLAA